MTTGKRLFDVVWALGVMVLVSPIMVWIAFRIWRMRDGPVFYVAERMNGPDRAFGLIKFRTMTTVSADNAGVTGGDKTDRITEIGKALRKRRLDELPQLWNILCGHMSFVGPRPPLREYVERFSDIYTEVLKSRPGVTGLATLIYNKREAQLLAECATPQQTDQVYCDICIPAKAKLDLIYQRRYRPCLDYWIIWSTLRQITARDKEP